MTAAAARGGTDAAAAIDRARATGRIGPNAIIRLIEALTGIEGAPATGRVFRAAGLSAHLRAAPTGMVAETDVARLHQALRADLGEPRAARVARRAGELTADYLLAHRIPKPAQTVLRCCPAPLASRLLAAAIGKNAWTFAGTGQFSVQHRPSTIFAIADCPLCRNQRALRPLCDFYAGTFERLYKRLVDPRAHVSEIACQAMGAEACRFEIRWNRGRDDECQTSCEEPAGGGRLEP
jgi:divinyl protochlorophyllide a 8-vinyl-reductase